MHHQLLHLLLFLLYLVVNVRLSDAIEHSPLFRCILPLFIHVQELLELQSELASLLVVSLLPDMPDVLGSEPMLVLVLCLVSGWGVRGDDSALLHLHQHAI